MMHCMRTITIFTLFLFPLVLGCSQGSVMDGGYLLGKTDLKLMKQTTEAIDFDFGYDTEFDIFYVFSFSHSKKNMPAKERELAKVVGGANLNELANFYSRVIKMHMSIDHKINFFKNRQDWKNYTYYKNYLLPPMEEYRSLIKNAVIARNIEFNEFDRAGEKNAKNWAAWYYKYQEEAVDTVLH